MPITRDAVIAILRDHEAPLRRQGVLRAVRFGSTARDEATSDSDLDIMVDIDLSVAVAEADGSERVIYEA